MNKSNTAAAITSYNSKQQTENVRLWKVLSGEILWEKNRAPNDNDEQFL